MTIEDQPVRWFLRFAHCPICGMQPRAFWLFGDPTGETFWRYVDDEQICHTCARWRERFLGRISLDPARRALASVQLSTA